MKNNIWEETFSDNYKPTLPARIIKKLEKYRQDEMLTFIPKKAGTFVDLACGDGNFINRIYNRFDRLIGYDIARNRIQNAKKKLNHLGNKAEFKAIDLDKGILLSNKSVDVVVCEASLSYFNDVNFILSEVKRILKKDGVFILQVPNYAFLPRRLALLFGQLPQTSSFEGFGDGGAKHYFTYQLLIKLLTGIGFKLVAQSNSGVLHSLRKVRPQLLAGDIILVVSV